MKGRWLAAASMTLGLIPVAGAEADTYCAPVTIQGCTSAQEAFGDAIANPGPDRIELGALSEAGTFVDAAGEPVDVVGAGVGATQLESPLRLAEAGSSVRGVAVGGSLELAGLARHVDVRGRLVALAGTPLVESATVVADEALFAACGTTLEARHLTLLGGVEACPTGPSVTLRTSIVSGTLTGQVQATWSNVPGVAGEGNVDVDPGFVSTGDLHLRAGSPMIEAGDPSPLAAGEPLEDRDGFVRVVDGDGDGTARRDMGALEYQPPATPLPAGNLLADPGAEDAGSTAWSASGSFTVAHYGTSDAGSPFPSSLAARALGADARFFSGGPVGQDSAAVQVVDVNAAAPEIDAGAGRVTLSALLGGYGSDGDAGSADVTFRGPSDEPLGALTIGPVGPGDRGAATNLLPRSSVRAVPPLTRRVAVTLRADHDRGNYNDAYFDNVSLLLGLGPGRPAGGGPGVPRVALRPFAGVSILSPVARLDSKGRARVRLGCASATVGRCRGTVTLTAVLKKGASATTIGRKKNVSLARGRSRYEPIRITRAARVRVRRARRLRSRLYAAFRDGQGVTRNTTAPLTLRPRRR